MLLNSLIFLLLSNSITSRRDKSILYSRVAISILLLSALITYDNLSLLFLAKGIGIFGGLFHTFHIFIFLITFSLMTFSLINYSKVLSVLYFSEPLFLTLSDDLIMSGFYTGKGKGKAIDVPVEEKPKSPTESEMDWEEEERIKTATASSLIPNKVGESSKSKGYKENSPEELDLYQKLANYTQDWKISNDMFFKFSRLHYDLKIKLDKQTVKSEEDLKLLTQYFNKCNELKLKKNRLEEVLMENGVDPSDQFSSRSSSYSGSSSSPYSSDYSQKRDNKRVKYSNVDNNLNFSLSFIVFNITPILRILSYIISPILLLVINFNILPNLDLCFIKIDLSQLLFLYLIVTLTKLIHKWYSVVITLYNHFLKKDYTIIYFNIYFSIVIILLYFSSNSDVCTFFFL
jgi:hypothetical protein